MERRFDYFVIFAGMRTGSNYLERNINSIPDLLCHGELFNPFFVAHEENEDYQGITLEMREHDPFQLVEKVKADAYALGGFRLFHDHDPRVRAAALDDPRCAKIVLTRNPVETYVSWQMAEATDQWVLTDAKGKKDVKITFKPEQFRDHLENYQSYIQTVRHRIRATGQTAFELDYADMQDLEVLAGLVKWLGSAHELTRFDRSLKKQNPSAVRDKVENVAEMEGELAALDPFGLGFTPVFEPTRGPAVRGYLASRSAGLVAQPIPGTATDALAAWLQGVSGCEGPETGMNQKELRQWLRDQPGALALTVLRHPIPRAWEVFEQKILPSDLQSFSEIRLALTRRYAVPLPEQWPTEAVRPGEVRRGFVKFLKFLKSNMAGQTFLRIDPLWASQFAQVQAFSQVRPPDLILREEAAAEALAHLATQRGLSGQAFQAPASPDLLAAVYDEQVEAAARNAYARDYMMFGFSDWMPPSQG